MSLFVDPSALLAMVDRKARFHRRAREVWSEFAPTDRPLISTNYVVLETCTLALSRLGLAALRGLQDPFISSLSVIWIDRELHDAGLAHLIREGRRRVSLVDHTSFEVMRHEGLREAFAFDPHFSEAGFHVVP